MLDDFPDKPEFINVCLALSALGRHRKVIRFFWQKILEVAIRPCDASVPLAKSVWKQLVESGELLDLGYVPKHEPLPKKVMRPDVLFAPKMHVPDLVERETQLQSSRTDSSPCQVLLDEMCASSSPGILAPSLPSRQEPRIEHCNVDWIVTNGGSPFDHFKAQPTPLDQLTNLSPNVCIPDIIIQTTSGKKKKRKYSRKSKQRSDTHPFQKNHDSSRSTEVNRQTLTQINRNLSGLRVSESRNTENCQVAAISRCELPVPPPSNKKPMSSISMLLNTPHLRPQELTTNIIRDQIFSNMNSTTFQAGIRPPAVIQDSPQDNPWLSVVLGDK